MEIPDVVCIERSGVFSQDDIAVVRGGGSSNARAVAPEEFFLFFGRAIGEFLVGAALDAQFAVRIASQAFGFVIAFGDVGSLVVLFHPGIDVLHIEGDNLAETRDLLL